MRYTVASALCGLALLAGNAAAQQQKCPCFTATQFYVADDCEAAACHVWSTTTIPQEDRNCPKTTTITRDAACPTGTQCNTYWMTSFYSTSTCIGQPGNTQPSSTPKPPTSREPTKPTSTRPTSTRSTPTPSTPTYTPTPTPTSTRPRPPQDPTTITTTTSRRPPQDPTTSSTSTRRPPQESPSNPGNPGNGGNGQCPAVTITSTQTPDGCGLPDCIRFGTVTVPGGSCGRVATSTVIQQATRCPECTTIMQTVTAGERGGSNNGGGIVITIH